MKIRHSIRSVSKHNELYTAKFLIELNIDEAEKLVVNWDNIDPRDLSEIEREMFAILENNLAKVYGTFDGPNLSKFLE